MIPFEQMGLQQIRRISQEIDQGSHFQNLLVLQPTSLIDTAHYEGELFQTGTNEDNNKDAAKLNSFNPYVIIVECQLEPSGVRLQLSFDSQVIHQRQVWRMMWQLEHIL